MATTEDRIDEVQELERLWRESPAAFLLPRTPRRRTDEDGWSRRLLVAWTAIFGSMFFFEPVPANPDVREPAWVIATMALFVPALIATFGTLIARRRAGAVLSLAAAALGIPLAVACFSIGHHLGAWPWVELAGFGALAGLSVAALRARA
jgi:hypothetical protein